LYINYLKASEISQNAPQFKIKSMKTHFIMIILGLSNDWSHPK